MRSNTNQAGAAHVGVIIVVILVLVAVGFVFWRVQDEATQEPEPQTTSEVEQDDAIESEADLLEVEEELNATDIDGELDVDELDAVID